MKTADLLVYNATIYTVDNNFSMAEAMVIKDGKILETGSAGRLREKYEITEELNAARQFVYPGFNDAHTHFVGYGLSLNNVNVAGTGSWKEIIDSLKAFAVDNPEGWIIGRGWDQNDWDVKDFPVNDELNKLFPHRPVFLTRIDGHAAIANDTALKAAGILAGDTISGGEIVTKDGKLTGVLIDNAMGLVRDKMPVSSKEQIIKGLQRAQDKCFAVGLTSVTDCGLSNHVIEILREEYENESLKMRINAMLSDAPENYQWLKDTGIITTDQLVVRSFKLFADGALGSRGACLLHPYSDYPETRGFMLKSMEYFDSIAAVIYKNNWQMATHAIGDSANRNMLKVYAKYLKGRNDARWRIEHAQIIDPADFTYFGDYGIIPSVQPTHATSDMAWATDRLGSERIKTAYAYKQLLEQIGWMPLSTDFPVEDISPFKTFYAAVFRRDANGEPANGFQPENALNRAEALRGITLWPARAAFEEKKKGSLEKGKLADFIILDTDLMRCNAEDVLKAKVSATYVAGKKVYPL